MGNWWEVEVEPSSYLKSVVNNNHGIVLVTWQSNHLKSLIRTSYCWSSLLDLYLKLEDVTRRFVKPCIMDVKLGQRSYDPFASQEKREQQIRKYPLMEEIGFLVLGMRVSKICFMLWWKKFKSRTFWLRMAEEIVITEKNKIK